jgi:hypothetical protein
MLRKLKFEIKQILLAFQCYNKPKIYCIGKNKTGTTSLHALFASLGYKVAVQRRGEALADDWIKGDFKRIVRFAKYGGEVFQDVPFSLPHTYEHLAKNYPDSKFILTVRDDADVWYNSLTKFHAKKFGNGLLPPTSEQLKEITYRGKGWAWRLYRALHDTPEDDLYKAEILKADYVQHNEAVIEYFKETPERLLILNLKEHDASKKLSDFLDLEKGITHIPWENKTT